MGTLANALMNALLKLVGPKRHQRLDQEIEEEQKRPAADEIRLYDLKRKKLKIKEELTTLKPN